MMKKERGKGRERERKNNNNNNNKSSKKYSDDGDTTRNIKDHKNKSLLQFLLWTFVNNMMVDQEGMGKRASKMMAI